MEPRSATLQMDSLPAEPQGKPGKATGKATGSLQKNLYQHAPFRTAAATAPITTASHCWPTPLQETLKHSQASLAQSLVRLLLLSPGSWYAQEFVFALQEFLFPSVLWKFCYQIPLSFQIRLSGHSQSLCQIPRLRSISLVCVDNSLWTQGTRCYIFEIWEERVLVYIYKKEKMKPLFFSTCPKMLFCTEKLYLIAEDEYICSVFQWKKRYLWNSMVNTALLMLIYVCIPWGKPSSLLKV